PRSACDGLTPAAGGSQRFLLTSWATPFYPALYPGTRAVAAYSSSEPRLWALACWSIAAIYGPSARLFRHPPLPYPATGAAVLATVLAVLWRSEGAAWGSLALAGVIVQEGLRLAGVPMLDQPPRWAALALIAGVLSFIIPSRRRDALGLWRRPLYLGSIGTG